jgi:hypothetical protein
MEGTGLVLTAEFIGFNTQKYTNTKTGEAGSKLVLGFVGDNAFYPEIVSIGKDRHAEVHAALDGREGEVIAVNVFAPRSGGLWFRSVRA